jgi:hypothetical protein
MTAHWRPNIDRSLRSPGPYWIAHDILNVPRAITKSAQARSCRWEPDGRTTRSTTRARTPATAGSLDQMINQWRSWRQRDGGGFCPTPRNDPADGRGRRKRRGYLPRRHLGNGSPSPRPRLGLFIPLKVKT